MREGTNWSIEAVPLFIIPAIILAPLFCLPICSGKKKKSDRIPDPPSMPRQQISYRNLPGFDPDIELTTTVEQLQQGVTPTTGPYAGTTPLIAKSTVLGPQELAIIDGKRADACDPRYKTLAALKTEMVFDECAMAPVEENSQKKSSVRKDLKTPKRDRQRQSRKSKHNQERHKKRKTGTGGDKQRRKHKRKSEKKPKQKPQHSNKQANKQPKAPREDKPNEKKHEPAKDTPKKDRQEDKQTKPGEEKEQSDYCLPANEHQKAVKELNQPNEQPVPKSAEVPDNGNEPAPPSPQLQNNLLVPVKSCYQF